MKKEEWYKIGVTDSYSWVGQFLSCKKEQRFKHLINQVTGVPSSST